MFNKSFILTLVDHTLYVNRVTYILNKKIYSKMVRNNIMQILFVNLNDFISIEFFCTIELFILNINFLEHHFICNIVYL
jgi:hypothetical protein